MKTQSPSESKPKNQQELIVDSHGAWANGWSPAWDSATDQSNSGQETEENSKDRYSARGAK
jgi:hypothetical protein